MGLSAVGATAPRAALRGSEMFTQQWSRLWLSGPGGSWVESYTRPVWDGWKGARRMAASGPAIPSLSPLGRD